MLIVLVMISQAIATPAIIMRDGVNITETIELINSIPSQYYKGIRSIDFRMDTVKPDKHIICGYYVFNYNIKHTENIYYSKIIIYINPYCPDTKEILIHELGHHNELINNKGIIELSEDYAEKFEIEEKLR